MAGRSTKFPEVVGTRSFVQPGGSETRVTMLNNAATTPPFKETLKVVRDCLQTYSALHRGAGPNARVTCQKTERAIADIKDFLGIEGNHELLFTSNTSSAINLLSRLLAYKSGVVLTSMFEHTSNDLPWRRLNNMVYANVNEDGTLDYEDLEKKALENKGYLKVVAITGASNLTGYMPDLRRIAEIAHKNDALFFVDAAQLVPHRRIEMEKSGIDALAFSGHKLYAPFGLGVLAVPKDLLWKSYVTDPGGGSVDMISDSGVIWASPLISHQAGTWNVTGIVSTAASCKILQKVGWNSIEAHERDLISYMLKGLSSVEGLGLYISEEKYSRDDRIGTFPFKLKNYHHALLSAILENEYGIETRAGTICNHRLVRKWLRVDGESQREIENMIRSGDRLASYGVVRASLGIQNTREDIDMFIAALNQISYSGPKLSYKPIPKEEIYVPS